MLRNQSRLHFPLPLILPVEVQDSLKKKSNIASLGYECETLYIGSNESDGQISHLRYQFDEFDVKNKVKQML